MMKKITKIALALATCVVASNAQADMVFGVYAGVQGWDMGAKGSFGSGNNSSANFAYADQTQNSYYLAIEHPVPILPNFKVKYNEMKTDGDTTLTETFVFNDVNFSVTSNLATVVDLSNTDFVLYYEIFDNDLLTFDIGLNVKKVQGDLSVKTTNVTPAQSAAESFTGYVPMLYGNVEIGLPFTGLGLFADGSFLSVGDHTLYDYEVGIGYKFIDNLAVDMTVQLGYRALKLELQDLDDINSNLEFDGMFLGLEAHF